MLRTVVQRTAPVVKHGGAARRFLVTSSQKRALSKEQLEGSTPKDKAPTGGAPPPPPPSSTDSGSSVPIALLGGLALIGGAGAAHYYGAITIPGLPVAGPAEVEETPAVEESTIVEKTESSDETETVTTTTTTTTEEEEVPTGPNKVVQIQVPEGEHTTPEIPETSHPTDGNKVTMEVYKHAAAAQEEANSGTVAVEKSIEELRQSIEVDASDAVKQAKKALTNDLDTSLFENMDSLNESQLKARVMQLAAELKERTRWEALRLKEFLAMKEKETSDKYLEILQQQRLEAEAVMARRLREQEHELVQSANATLREQQGSVEGLINDTVEKLSLLHEQEKKALVDQTIEEVRASSEKEYLEKLETFKKEALAEMERKVSAVKSLKKKLAELEKALKATQNIQSGSIQAHRLSAAALALAEKMEGNKGAKVELNALKLAVGDNEVIGAALSSVPDAITEGIPTLPELQAKYEKVYKKGREAALVPAGQPGLEGQLLGMLFSTVKFPPKPEDEPPEDDKDAAEYVLVRAKEYVNTGELERAVEQLDKLKGQTAFTVKAWKEDAANRVAVEKALKVIKMECALLNKNMGDQA